MSNGLIQKLIEDLEYKHQLLRENATTLKSRIHNHPWTKLMAMFEDIEELPIKRPKHPNRRAAIKATKRKQEARNNA